MFQEESAVLWHDMRLSCIYLYVKWQSYGDNGEISFKQWELIYLLVTKYNKEECIVLEMLTPVFQST